MHFFSVPEEAGFKMHVLTNLLYNTADRGAVDKWRCAGGTGMSSWEGRLGNFINGQGC